MAEQRSGGGRPIAASQRPTGGDKAFGGKKQYFRRKKMCRFCVEKIDDINYKDVRLLMAFISERGKITPRRTSAGWRNRSSRRATSRLCRFQPPCSRQSSAISRGHRKLMADS
jgi:ribosomal protein S18